MRLAPVMRTDEHHVQKHKSIMEMKNKEVVEVVFLGDSLTRRWEDNSHLWEEFFSKYHPANLGVGSDCIEHVLWRLENGELDGLRPRLVLLLIGTNNLAKDPEDVIVEGILEVARTIKRKCPAAKLVVFGLLPRDKDESGRDCSERIAGINRELSGRAGAAGYHYAYFGELALGRDGGIDRAVMPDGLHLNEAGYRLAGPLIQKVIEGLI